MREEDDVTAALAEMARDDVTALLGDVRRDALRLARSRLVEAYAEALVRAVVRRGGDPAAEGDSGLRPPTPPGSPATGTYVYAVVAGDGTGAAGECGVEPGGPVGLVTAAGISAIVSDVDVDAMRAGGSQAEIDEDGWLANAVRAHERVVLAAFHSAPTVPMRFGIVHPDREAVQRLLVEHADAFRQELGRIEGAAEWSVKVSADIQAVTARLSGSPQEHDSGAAEVVGGRAYLLRERSRRELDDRVQAFIASHVQRFEALVTASARDVVATPASAADGVRAVFSAACLVERGVESRLATLVDRFATETQELGLAVEMSGPWPPYHFTNLRLGESDG